MLLIVSILLGTWLFLAVFSNDGADDDDDRNGGMMIPAYNPIS